MKTIKTANGSIMRMSDDQALKIVDNTDYYYCSKAEHRRAIRNGEAHIPEHAILEAGKSTPRSACSRVAESHAPMDAVCEKCGRRYCDHINKY